MYPYHTDPNASIETFQSFLAVCAGDFIDWNNTYILEVAKCDYPIPLDVEFCLYGIKWMTDNPGYGAGEHACIGCQPKILIICGVFSHYLSS
jgi:hypothetical protein